MEVDGARDSLAYIISGFKGGEKNGAKDIGFSKCKTRTPGTRPNANAV